MKGLTLSILAASGAWLSLPAGALGSVVSVTGQTELIAPPPVVGAGWDYASRPLMATVWDEQQGVSVTNLEMSLVNNPGDESNAVHGFLSGVVDSHYLHDFSSGAYETAGSVTFSGRILGVAFDDTYINNSDFLGAPGSLYDAWSPRGLQPGTYDFFQVNDRTLTFSFVGGYILDTVSLRVITEPVPAPGSAALLAAGALVAARRRRPSTPPSTPC